MDVGLYHPPLALVSVRPPGFGGPRLVSASPASCAKQRPREIPGAIASNPALIICSYGRSVAVHAVFPVVHAGTDALFVIAAVLPALGLAGLHLSFLPRTILGELNRPAEAAAGLAARRIRRGERGRGSRRSVRAGVDCASGRAPEECLGCRRQKDFSILCCTPYGSLQPPSL